jgi:hemerythrin-like domain-containing protein
VKGLEEAATRALNGEAGQEEAIVANARGYLELLREHISREDGILYPLAERVIPEEKRDGILEGYHAAEEKAAQGLEDHYRTIVEGYEKRKAA